MAGNAAEGLGEEPEGHQQAREQGDQAREKPFERENGHQPEGQHAERGGDEKVDG